MSNLLFSNKLLNAPAAASLSAARSSTLPSSPEPPLEMRSLNARSLLFIDPTVPDYQQLLAGVAPGTEVQVLNTAQDAISQITQTLLTKSGIASVHIVSHGEAGGLDFGSGVLNLADLPQYATQIQSWGRALTDDADILLYGCNVAQGELGKAFVSILSQLTRADVVASNDLTGSSAQGGNWTLEVSTGKIETSPVFTAPTLANYNAILSLTRVSTAADGTQGNSVSAGTSISADGRYVVFNSSASNLVSGDTNGLVDVFVKDLKTGAVTRVSTAADGTQGNGESYDIFSSISADGRYVAFRSFASNLVSGDTNGTADIFVKDLQTGAITRVSTAADGTQGNGESDNPSMSADGRYVAFESKASNLVSDDTNDFEDAFVKDLQTGAITRVSATAGIPFKGTRDPNIMDFEPPSISANGRYVAFESLDDHSVDSFLPTPLLDLFVKDLQTGAITLVSSAADGTPGNSDSSSPSISADGRYVAFESGADNLVSGDTRFTNDIFVKDLQTGAVTLVSSAADGTRGNGSSRYTSMSADGRYVAFQSSADNLVSGDTNGTTDIFVKDLQTGAITLISAAAPGIPSNDQSWFPSISADGHYVAFYSLANNLVSGDTNGTYDVFVSGQFGIPPNRPAFDANGDGKADLLWRNQVTGEVQVWQANGTRTTVATPDLNWQIEQTADFDGDGKTDILWRNLNTGEVGVWLMNGDTVKTYANIATVSDANWQIEQTADFDGDGKTDILWRNLNTGVVGLWLMNGDTVKTYANVATVSDANWQIQSSADFDGDGKTDILWRNLNTGVVGVWLMNGDTVKTYANVATVSDSNWQIEQTADFDGDGKTDILWRNLNTGEVGLWLMNGDTVKTYANVATVSDSNWQIEQTADFNGDGKADVLWHNRQTGENGLWLMDGVRLVSNNSLPTEANLNWQLELEG